MKKRLFALALALALAAGPVRAFALDVPSQPAPPADAETLFPAKNSYAGFSDVPGGSWYEPYITLCFETGLMLGAGTQFSPAGTLTGAEAAVIAARFAGAINGLGGALPEGEPGSAWYAGAADYLAQLGAALPEDLTAPISRQAFFSLLAAVTPDELLAPVNNISALPDTEDAAVLAFYNAGILTGTDAFGAFSGGRTLSRAEAAAILARLIRPALRVSFAPVDPGDIIWTLSGLSRGTALFTSASITIRAEDFFPWVVYYTGLLERASLEQGVSFRWDNEYGDETFLAYVARQAEGAARRYAVIGLQAASYGVELTEDNRRALDDRRAAAVEALGGEEAFSASLQRSALSEESYRRLGELDLLYVNLGIFLHTPSDSALAAFLQRQGTPGLDPDEGRRLYSEAMIKNRLSQWTAELSLTATAQGAALSIPAFYDNLLALRAELDSKS